MSAFLPASGDRRAGSGLWNAGRTCQVRDSSVGQVSAEPRIIRNQKYLDGIDDGTGDTRRISPADGDWRKEPADSTLPSKNNRSAVLAFRRIRASNEPKALAAIVATHPLVHIDIRQSHLVVLLISTIQGRRSTRSWITYSSARYRAASASRKSVDSASYTQPRRLVTSRKIPRAVSVPQPCRSLQTLAATT